MVPVLPQNSSDFYSFHSVLLVDRDCSWLSRAFMYCLSGEMEVAKSTSVLSVRGSSTSIVHTP